MSSSIQQQISFESQIILDAEMPHRDFQQGKSLLSIACIPMSDPLAWLYLEGRMLSGKWEPAQPEKNDPGSKVISGFANENVRHPGKLTQYELIARVLSWRLHQPNGGIFVSQNSLDWQYFEGIAKRTGTALPSGLYRGIDLHTAALDYAIRNGIPVRLSNEGTSTVSLPTIASWFNVDLDAFRGAEHSALVDAVVTAQLRSYIVRGRPVYRDLAHIVEMAEQHVKEYRKQFKS